MAVLAAALSLAFSGGDNAGGDGGGWQPASDGFGEWAGDLTCRIERRANLSAAEFLAEYWSARRPVFLTYDGGGVGGGGGAAHTAELRALWSRAYLLSAVGDMLVDVASPYDRAVFQRRERSSGGTSSSGTQPGYTTTVRGLRLLQHNTCCCSKLLQTSS